MYYKTTEELKSVNYKLEKDNPDYIFFTDEQLKGDNETKYNCVISSMNLLILHPKYETYHWVKLPKMQNEVDYMFSTLKQIT